MISGFLILLSISSWREKRIEEVVEADNDDVELLQVTMKPIRSCRVVDKRLIPISFFISFADWKLLIEISWRLLQNWIRYAEDSGDDEEGRERNRLCQCLLHLFGEFLTFFRLAFSLHFCYSFSSFLPPFAQFCHRLLISFFFCCWILPSYV